MSAADSSRVVSSSDHVTPYDRFGWSDTDIERLLVTGEHQRELIAYFRADEYRTLAKLAAQGARKPLDKSAPQVFIVPGIMGSQLGLRRRSPQPDDVLWLDPIDISVGRLAALRLTDHAPIIPLGVVLHSYLRLKLFLRTRGFAPEFHDYDWRLDVDELGKSLAHRVSSSRARRVMIVAHSMGGLVSRAALTRPGMSRVERLILLGTPHFGSFAPLQALRGTYAVVRKIATLARSGSAESLASTIFNTFPSLYQMLPLAQRHGCMDFFDPTRWPSTGPQPDVALLRSASAIQDKLAPGDGRMAAIVGVGQETVTAAVRRGEEFIYTVTRRGDGTVPAVSAALPGADTYYTSVAHSDLTRDFGIFAAIAELLRTGTTKRLPERWRSSSAAQARIGDQQLRRTYTEKVDWAHLEPEERRIFLQNLNEPPQLRLRVPAARKSPTRKR